MKRFDEELSAIKELILSMGGLVEKAIADATTAVLKQDKELARQTVDGDRSINTQEVRCDELIRDILVRRQPAAGDLRLIMASVKVVTDLERMGDLAAGIAEGVLTTLDHPPRTFSSLEILSEKAQRQVNRALDAFSREDFDLAMTVIEKDKGIDKIYRSMYRELVTYMMEDARNIEASIVLTNIAKGLERIADHATNIAEMVIYITHGHDIRHVDNKAAAALVKGKE